MLACAANDGFLKTFDGIAAGAQRVANEVRRTVAAAPDLETISMVGNSLGGLYARQALAALYDDANAMDRCQEGGIIPRRASRGRSSNLSERGAKDALSSRSTTDNTLDARPGTTINITHSTLVEESHHRRPSAASSPWPS